MAGIHKRTRTGRISRIEQEHARTVWKKYLFIIVLAAVLIIGSCVIITLGQVPITITDVYSTLFDKFVPGVFSIEDEMAHVIWQIRVPLILGAIVSGFGLGICGCVMQAVLKNPLASPFTLGISAGAQLGISIGAVLGVTILGGPYFLIGNAFICALLCSGVIIALSSLKGATSETLILAGVALMYLFQAANQLLSYVATDEQRTLMTLWGMGSLADLNWLSIGFLLAVSALCLPLLYSKAWDLNLMTVGDDSAKSMGVDANRVRVFIMVVSSLLVSAIVAFIGVIGFIGLVAPHICRMLIGSDHRYLIPAAGGVGAALLLIANAIAMNLLGGEVVPTGIIMSVIGVPFFLYLILKGKRKEYWS
ncbi:MAG: iron ABC transporter permease [Methanomicrobiales archaeon]|nr:iron ABC transporter permease [Methanomicrobiales archaeon]